MLANSFKTGSHVKVEGNGSGEGKRSNVRWNQEKGIITVDKDKEIWIVSKQLY